MCGCSARRAGIPTHAFTRFLPVMWFGLWLNVMTGIVLLIAYPTKALTNPVFYLKLSLIAVALTILRSILRRLGRPEPASGGSEGARSRLARHVGGRHRGGPAAGVHVHAPDSRFDLLRHRRMVPFQVWLEATLRSFTQVGLLMKQEWSWPIAESIHFARTDAPLRLASRRGIFDCSASRGRCRSRRFTAWCRSPCWDSRPTPRAERSS